MCNGMNPKRRIRTLMGVPISFHVQAVGLGLLSANMLIRVRKVW